MKKRVVGKSILFLAILVAISSVALGATIYVNNTYPTCDDITGTPYCSIQPAINNAVAGDIISVSIGTYNEDLTIPAGKDNLILTGGNKTTTVIKGVANVPVASWPLAAPNIEILSDGVKIYGFTIQRPDYVAGKYTSGVVIGAKNVEIYNNNFIVNSGGGANSDEVSQAIQTYATASIPAADASGLNIHDNFFNSTGAGDWGYEGIYLNPDAATGAIFIENNTLKGKVLRAITSERSKTSIIGNTIETDLAPSDLSTAGAYQGINVRVLSAAPQSDVTIDNNIVMGSASGQGFYQGIRIGQAGQTLTNFNISGNVVQYNANGILVKSASGVTLRNNEIKDNSIYGIKNEDSSVLDATNNWWGSNTGPFHPTLNPTGLGNNVSDNVMFIPWISTAAIDSLCIGITAPNQIIAGRQATINVVMKNIGQNTWTEADNYRLGSQNPQDNLVWGLNRINMSPAASILTGQEYVFVFNITAPTATGIYSSDWEPVKEYVAWFGATCQKNIQVVTNCVDNDLDTYFAFDAVECPAGNDCNDNNSTIHPGATEICNGVNDDCNSQTDEGLTAPFNSNQAGVCLGSNQTCAGAAGWIDNYTYITTYQNPETSCDGLDNDCDTQTDENLKTTFYFDFDNDAFGNISVTFQNCSKPVSYVLNSTDCNDGTATIYPGAAEVAYDGIDQNCDGFDLRDIDNDTHNATIVGGNDCNDNDASIYPGAIEIPYDTIDQNCDGFDFPIDGDSDGHNTTLVAGGDDCNDTNPSVYPGAVEIIGDGIDQDCDGFDFLPDADHDGYNATAAGGTDCEDTNPSIHPGALEIDNSIDDNCNNITDEGFCNVSIVSPISKNYSTSRVLFNITTGCEPRLLRYSDIGVDYHTIMYGNLTYTPPTVPQENYLNPARPFADGDHLITVEMTDYDGNKYYSNSVDFFVDSQAPRIIDQYPRNNQYGNGTFTVVYSEYYTDRVLLYWKLSTETSFNEVSLSGCGSGVYMKCSKTIDVSAYQGKLIDYFFIVYDRVTSDRSNPDRIKIDVEPAQLFVNLPRDQFYLSRNVLVDAYTDQTVKKLEYSDNSGNYFTLCVNCNKFNKTKIFDDGNHNVTIRATKESGLATTKTVSFKVDSTPPRILNQKPENKKYANGTFQIYYTESNLQSITLYYKGIAETTYQTKTLPCTSGRNQLCEFNVNLAAYDGSKINYYFNLQDPVRNILSPTIFENPVDLTKPTITIIAPLPGDKSRSVPFNIALSEKVSVLSVSDNSAGFRTVCSNCNGYKGTRAFNKGNHVLVIKAEDYAGNTNTEPANFVVN